MTNDLDDKEVGILWSSVTNKYSISDVPSWWPEQIIALIRKLVKERALRKYGGAILEEEAMVFKDFGIDPATWLELGRPEGKR